MVQWVLLFFPPVIESQALAGKPDGEGKSQGNSCVQSGEKPVQIGGERGGERGGSQEGGLQGKNSTDGPACT